MTLTMMSDYRCDGAAHHGAGLGWRVALFLGGQVRALFYNSSAFFFDAEP